MAERGGAPAYYRQNFHFQSGSFTTSAGRYEAQVEALFAGTASDSLLARAWIRQRNTCPCRNALA